MKGGRGLKIYREGEEAKLAKGLRWQCRLCYDVVLWYIIRHPAKLGLSHSYIIFIDTEIHYIAGSCGVCATPFNLKETHTETQTV